MIDKGLNFKRRVGLKGGADAATESFSKSAGSTRPGRKDPTGGFNLSGGQGPTFGGAPASQTSGDRGRESREEFIRSVQKTNPNFTGRTPRNNFFTRGLNFAKRNPLQVLLGAINPIFGAAMFGANFLNNPERRKRLTGYETQAEYDEARQNRINLNRIKTLENTIQKKYLDKGRSLDETELDERLAGLKSQMGITPNTAADLRPDLDFSNNPELAFEGVATKVPGGITEVMINEFGQSPQFNTSLINEFGQSPQFTTSLIDEFGVKDRGIVDANEGLQFGSIPGTSDQGYVSPFGTADDVTANLLGVPGSADDVTANLLGVPGSADDPYANLLGVPGTADYYGSLPNTSTSMLPANNLVAGLTEKQKQLLDQRKGMLDVLGDQGILDTIKSEDDPNNPATLEDVRSYYGIA
tara:strand:+ start:60 stop:1295 length:1236 start_codon:yes stop_codon:yes gene_type:complete